jgi:hypothetical protein
VRFRVESEVWHDQTPRKFRRDEREEMVGVRRDVPYTIIVSTTGGMSSLLTPLGIYGCPTHGRDIVVVRTTRRMIEVWRQYGLKTKIIYI